jgi:serine protease Do
MPKVRRRLLWLLSALALAGPASAQSRNNELLRSSPRFLNAFRDVVGHVSSGVVRISCDDSDVALGIVVDEGGWVLTKAHDLAGTVICKLRDGRAFAANVIGVHERHDVALLQIAATGLTAVELADSSGARPGDWVASAGLSEYPLAVGVISVPTRDLTGPRDRDPAQAPYLGVGLELTDEGVRISEVLAGTAAARAGLRTGDVILDIAGFKIRDPDSFVEAMARHRPGDTIALRIGRASSEWEVRATLERRPQQPRVDVQNRMGSELSSRRTGYTTFLQHDTVLRPCDCGGPLVNLEGRVVGLNICRAGRVETWALPAELLRALLPDLKSGKLAPPAASVRGAATPAERVDAVLWAMSKRLLLMPEVARAKWNSGQSIHDPAREAQQLDRLVEQSRQHQLPAETVRHFFAAQMSAARRLQENLFEDWRRTDAREFEGVADLRDTLRPAIDRTSLDLLAAFARLYPYLDRPEVQDRLQTRSADALAGEGINAAVRQLAVAPLQMTK